MPDLIQVADDLKQMPDQWLAMQAQQPSGVVPPYLVVAEIQRRQKLRSGASKAQAPQSSVSQDLIRSLQARMPPSQGLPPGSVPPQAVPPGMPPPNLSGTGGGGGFGPPAPGTPPANLRMPQRMAEGGEVDDEEDPYQQADILRRLPSRDMVMAQLMGPPPQAMPDPGSNMGGADRMMPETPQMPQDAPVMNAIGGADRRMPEPQVPKFDDNTIRLVRDTALRYKLDPTLLFALLSQESGGDPNAVSGKGAIGLMQIMPATARAMGVSDPALLKDPAVNIDTGARYFKGLLDQFGDPKIAIAAYNAGPGAVQKYKGIPPYRETMGHVTGVMDTVNRLRGNLPPITGGPAQSRLLGTTQESAPGGQMVGMAASNQPQPQTQPQTQPAQPPPNLQMQAGDVTAGGGTGEEETAEAAPVVAKKQPLHQTWTQPESAQTADLQKQIETAMANHQPLSKQLQDVYSEENLNTLNRAAEVLVGKRPDYSKYSSAIDSVMKIAERNMHPRISDALIQFGTALMASRSPKFRFAIGPAMAQAATGMQDMQKQGMKDFLTAAKAGVELQDKMNDYDAKIGQYKMQRLGAMQTGVIQDERTFQSQIAQLQRRKDTAQAAFDKAITSPAAQQTKAMAVLNREGVQLDPQLNDPVKQIARDLPQFIDEVQGAGKARAAAGPTTTQITQERRSIGMLAERNDPWDPENNPGDAQYPSAFDKLKAKYPQLAGKVTVAGGVTDYEMQRQVQSTIAGMKDGTIPPVLTGNRSQQLALREEARKQGFNLSEAELEWKAMLKFMQSANSDHQLNFQRAVYMVPTQIQAAKTAFERWKQAGLPTGFSDFNHMALEASARLPGEAGVAAREIQQAISILKQELPTVMSGGYAPHDSQIKMGHDLISSDWNEGQFYNGLDKINDIVLARQRATKLAMPFGVRPDSPYLKTMPGAGQGGGNQPQQEAAPPPLPGMLSPNDKGKIFTAPGGKKIRILDVNPNDWHKYRAEEVK